MALHVRMNSLASSSCLHYALDNKVRNFQITTSDNMTLGKEEKGEQRIITYFYYCKQARGTFYHLRITCNMVCGTSKAYQRHRCMRRHCPTPSSRLLYTFTAMPWTVLHPGVLIFTRYVTKVPLMFFCIANGSISDWVISLIVWISSQSIIVDLAILASLSYFELLV